MISEHALVGRMLTLSFCEGILLGDKAYDAVGSLPVLGPRVLIHGVHRVIVDTCTRLSVNTTPPKSKSTKKHGLVSYL